LTRPNSAIKINSNRLNHREKTKKIEENKKTIAKVRETVVSDLDGLRKALIKFRRNLALSNKGIDYIIKVLDIDNIQMKLEFYYNDSERAIVFFDLTNFWETNLHCLLN